MNKKGFLQISFPWMFAIIVGIAILFFTIYGLTKLIGTEDTIQDVKTSKELGILLNPLETGFEEATSSSLAFPVETRVHNICSDFGDFGDQIIQISQKSIGDKWTKTSIDVTFKNKYIFSNDPTEGKTMNLFSKSFEFPFKVSDLIYMTPDSVIYCFNDAPENIKKEIENLNQNNLLIENCSSEHINVCFSGGSSCDIGVSYANKYVQKEGEKLYFENDALMYGAIFSEKSVYECQLRRLMKRLVSLSELYQAKSNFVNQRGCTSNLGDDLQVLISSAASLSSSEDLGPLSDIVTSTRGANNANTRCKLW
jgi:hypothetical protein